MKEELKNVLFCSSCGGHLLQLQSVFKEFNLESCYFISELAKDSSEVCSKYRFKDKLLVSRIGSGSRAVWLLKSFFFNFRKFVKICLKSDLMLSTGGIASVIPGIICFVLRRKIIFVETIAKTDNLTSTARIFYHMSDHFYVQDENLCKKYEKAIFKGTIYKI